MGTILLNVTWVFSEKSCVAFSNGIKILHNSSNKSHSLSFNITFFNLALSAFLSRINEQDKFTFNWRIAHWR